MYESGNYVSRVVRNEGRDEFYGVARETPRGGPALDSGRQNGAPINWCGARFGCDSDSEEIDPVEAARGKSLSPKLP